MLLGNLYLAEDINFVRTVLSDPMSRTICMSMDEADDTLEREFPNLVQKSTILCPPPSAIYKEVDGELEECTVKEILERNIEGTTIKKCKVDVFFTGNLQQCYINYCKKLFDSLLNKCLTREHDVDIFARDFIWMTLNIIDYLIGFKQFMEAERLLAMFRTCGGFCDNHHEHKRIGCGCS